MVTRALSTEHLSGRLPKEAGPSNLSLDYPRPKHYIGNTAAVPVTLDALRFEQMEPLEVYAALMTALKVVLHKHTNSPSIVVGSPAPRSAIKALAIVNEIPLQSSLRQLQVAIRETLRQAYQMQGAPCADVIGDRGLANAQNQCPLFDVALRLEGLHGEMPDLMQDMTIDFARQDNQLCGQILYNTSLFDHGSVERFRNHLVRALEADPETTVCELDLRTESDLRMLAQWSETLSPFGPERCIHELFEEQVERTPEAIAVVFAEQRLTYRELNQGANQVARHLRAAGVGPEDLVGILLERSAQLVVAILGVLKAGGAYVPLDPKYPRDRLAFMLQDARAGVLLTQHSLASSAAAQTVFLDTDWPAISRQAVENLETVTTSHNLAVVIYTSGSTGQPKGVMLTHANLAHFVQAMRVTLGIAPEDVYLHTGSITYALSIRQLMVPLCHGARLIMASSAQISEPLSLFSLVKQQGVTRMDFVPSYWRSCNLALEGLPAAEREALLDNQLRHIVCVGEPLLSDIPRKWARDFRHPAQLTNIFGQTETTGLVAAYPIPDAHYECRVHVLPVGRPTANTRVYVLDSKMHPVAPGCPGEVFVCNPSVARGYLNRPDMTAEKFVESPLPVEPGERLYRTGDQARHRWDGALELLGRQDQQVKVRGMRVDLGEIEGTILSHPAISQCAVKAYEEAGLRLAAFYVARGSQKQVSEEALREFLRGQLADSMIPSVFLQVDAMPLTPTGKIDRQALPVPTRSMRHDPPSPGTRSNPVEETICQVLQELLQVEKVGIHDNFSDLGVHSLLLMQMQTRLTQALQQPISTLDLLRHATTRSLAEFLRPERRLSPSLNQARDRGDKRRRLRRPTENRRVEDG
ncbi:amino acid adenylation domain-containing protein [bacterium]|nr:amino acid adenylation domain-containing protein [bacterium]